MTTGYCQDHISVQLLSKFKRVHLKIWLIVKTLPFCVGLSVLIYRIIPLLFLCVISTINITSRNWHSRVGTFHHSIPNQYWIIRLGTATMYIFIESRIPIYPLSVTRNHSVESPSMVDPQWNIWYWGSKWNLHTVCWSAVGCEWGTTSVYFGITYVCFIPSRLPVFAVEPQYLLQYFLFLSKVSFELHIQNLQKMSCWFKIWMGFVGPILIKLWTSSIWGFL